RHLHLYDVRFFCQAEDGIRDRNVTGVQTCALPIWVEMPERHRPNREGETSMHRYLLGSAAVALVTLTTTMAGADEWPSRPINIRSEERRVGREGRTRSGQND